MMENPGELWERRPSSIDTATDDEIREMIQTAIFFLEAVSKLFGAHAKARLN